MPHCLRQSDKKAKSMQTGEGVMQRHRAAGWRSEARQGASMEARRLPVRVLLHRVLVLLVLLLLLLLVLLLPAPVRRHIAGIRM